MRIVIDLDGTICNLKQPGESYADVQIKAGAADFIKRLRKNGHYIIIQTARNMATCESNLGKVIKNVGKVTLEWLEKNEVEYDEIYFGKPNAHLYIDDRALRFESWDTLSNEQLETLAREK
ncbi:MAG: HAD family hydrolase [Bacteroidia bacterium]|jgi:capsule biosynthesis phosphatase|nr:HAD family hydrolase [Bacteroidia bacterium]